MITTLTEQQIAKFPQYIAEWTKRVLEVPQRTLEDAIIDFSLFYKDVLKKPSVPIVILDSPLECWLAVLMFTQNQNRSQVWSQVESQVRSQVQSQVANRVGNFIWPYWDAQFWAGFFSYYEYMRVELGVNFNKKYEVLKSCQQYGLVWPLDDICIVCQPMTICKRNIANQLHCETGPAVSYNGKNEIYALNGVVVPEKWVLTRAENIDPQEVMRETNVEIRRELLRKVGIERMLSALNAKVLDKKGDYELLSVKLSEEIPDARYLKMINPSIKIYHAEAVEPNISTVDAALLWRNNQMFVNPEILT